MNPDPPRPAGDDTFGLLRGSSLFDGIDDRAIAALAAGCRRLAVAAGQTVVRQGDTGDAMYVVVTGRLRVTVTDRGTEVTVNELGPGQVIGELALLGRHPRTATVTARRDSELLCLPAGSFAELVEREPLLLLALCRTLVERVAVRSRPLPPATATVAVIPAGRGDRLSADRVASWLRPALARHGDVAWVTAATVDGAVGPCSSQSGPGDGDDSAATAFCDRAERRHRFVVYQADAGPTAWTARCVRQADRILLVAHARDDPARGPADAALARAGGPARAGPQAELVLVHDAGGGRPSGTPAWYHDRSLAGHHHIRAGVAGDWARVGRRLAGREVGIVLGGGGPRGFAHLGVLRALEEAGVPLDVVGGTSIGALIGALFAMGWDHDRRLATAVEALGASRLLTGFNPPLVSMSSGRRVNRLLRRPDCLDATLAEDLWLPWFAVATNLSRADLVVFDRGPVWWAVRASISVPGILPPVHHGGDLLVDGGVMDNLPVGVMRGRIAGPVIAVDLDPQADLRRHRAFGDTISGWRVLGDRINPLTPPVDVPNALALVMRAREVGGRRAQEDRLAASPPDLLLRPSISAPAFNFKGGAPLAEAGYRYAVEALAGVDLAAVCGPGGTGSSR